MRLTRGGNIGRAATLFCIGMLIVGYADIEAAQWNGYMDNIGGIPSVMNPGEPMLPAETVKTEELWRVGVDDDEDAELIGFVTDVIVDQEGNSYLLDSTLNVIRVYGPQGALVREIGSEGEGPGEFGMARQFMLMPNQNIGVVQMMPAKIVTLDLHGIPGGHFSLGDGGGGMKMIQKASASDHSVVIGLVSPNFQDGSVVTTHSLIIVNSEGDPLHTIMEKKDEQHGGSISIGGGENEFTSQWSVSHDGKVFVAQYDHDYKIKVFNAQGIVERVIHREYESLKRTAEALAEDKERQADMAARFGASFEMEIQKLERDIEKIYPRKNGGLWVTTSRGLRNCPLGQIGIFDEFDAEGKFVRQISIDVEYDSDRDDYILLEDHLYILKEAQKQPATTSTGGGGGTMMVVMSGNPSNDEDDDDEGLPPGVVCYKLVR